jgi:hemoglobin
LADDSEAGPSLYQRLGETGGIENIVRKTIDSYRVNPQITAYFKYIDQEWLIGPVTALLAAGTGGPNHYAGSDMVAAHSHLDLTDEECDMAVADVLAALKAHDIDADSQAEVNTILQSFRGAIVSAGN